MLEDNKYFHYYNANPKNKRGKDCTYRAISLFLGISWEDIARLDAEFYLKHGMWLYTTEYIGLYFESRVDCFLENLGYKKVYQYSRKYGEGEYFPTVKDFIDRYAEKDKVYLCETTGHMLAIKGNKVWDTWDSSDRCPNMIFEN